MSVTVRPARPVDLPWLVELVRHPEVAPFLARSRPATELELVAELRRVADQPDGYGLLVIDVADEVAGTLTWERVNRRSAIAVLSGIVVHPRFRGNGVAGAALSAVVRELLGERGFHRIQLEVYGFNERAAAVFERAGFVREGIRRLAYMHDGAWVDGILFGLVAEDLDNHPAASAVSSRDSASGTSRRPSPRRMKPGSS